MPAFDESSSFAILFGVAKYDNSRAYESMSWIQNNLTELRAILVDKDLVGFGDDDDHVQVKLNPTYGQLGDDLEEIRTKHIGIDTLLVYYCGHGVVQGGKYYLTGTNSSDSVAGKLSFDTFEDIFLAIRAKRKLLILDSCFSGRAVPHLSDSTSVLEVNVDRLAEKERKSSEIDSTRKGTYVIASADRDKPSPSSDGTGELTAFTSLLVNRVRHGLERREDDRLTITDVVEALRTEASLKGLPEPVTSDKLGLGSWRLVGNAFVVKKKKFEVELGEKIEQTVSAAVHRLRAELSKLVLKTAENSEIEALKNDIRILTSQMDKLAGGTAASDPREASGTISRVTPLISVSELSNIAVKRRSPLVSISELLVETSEHITYILLQSLVWVAIAFAGVLILRVWQGIDLYPIPTPNSILPVKVYISLVYFALMFAVELKHQNVSFAGNRLRTLFGASLLLGSIGSILNSPFKLMGTQKFFWALLTGVTLTWLVPLLGIWLSQFSGLPK